MDYTMNSDTLATSTVVFDGTDEQPIDVDFTLPDYCPDIQRILKCHICPKISSKNISADRLDVEGTAFIKLMYVDSTNGKFHCFEHSMPFSSSFNLRSIPDDVVSIVTPKIEYVNCRAVSPRRLDIHGAFSLHAKVFGKEVQQIVSEIQEDDIEQKTISVLSSDLAGLGQSQFQINEVLEIPQGKPSIESIVKSDSKAILHECKSIANKLVIKGDLLIKVLYLSDSTEGNLETVEYSIPISQIIDVSDIDDNAACSIRLDIMNDSIEIREDSSGENNLLDIDAKISATATAYRDHDINLITDVYSTKYEISPTFKQTEIYRLVENLSDTYVDKQNIDIQDRSVSKIIDSWNDLCSISAKREDDKIVLKGKYNVCILGLDSENEPFYIERMLDFETTHDGNYDCPDIRLDISATIPSVSFRIAGTNEIEVRSEILISGPVYCIYTCKTISELTANEEHLKHTKNNPAVTIYYADPGESIWSIARKYSTSVDAIKSENDIEDDTIKEHGMLLIPM